MIGPELTKLLPELTLAQANELTETEIAHNIHSHPMLSEVLHKVAKDLGDGPSMRELKTLIVSNVLYQTVQDHSHENLLEIIILKKR